VAEYEAIGTWESADAITDFMVTAHAAIGHTMRRISTPTPTPTPTPRATVPLPAALSTAS
jgi:hypothetical protein